MTSLLLISLENTNSEYQHQWLKHLKSMWGRDNYFKYVSIPVKNDDLLSLTL